MGKDIIPIRGRQTLNPNPIGPECIKVTKVYDWVLISDRYSNKVDLPQDCIARIGRCRKRAGEVTATCEEVQGSRDCDVVASRPANVPGVEGARLVTLVLSFEIRIRFFCSGRFICEFTLPVSFTDEVILCNPPGTKINCNIFDVDCTVVLSRLLDNKVLIDVVMCADVQVEAEVKMEVEAKFCGPRQSIPVGNLRTQCDRFPLFPRQCPTFFPPENCECQGSASARNLPATVSVLPGSVDGLLTFNAVVCDQCALANSRLTVEFRDLPGEAPAGEAAEDQSFTFFATQFNEVVCPSTSITSGIGFYKRAGQNEINARFNLIIGNGFVQIIIRDEAGNSLANFSGAVPNATVGDCENFPNP